MGDIGELDALIDDLTLDAYGDDEQLAGFLVGAEEALVPPQAATVVGVPVEVLTIVDGPDARRGLEAVCIRAGANYSVALADVVFARGSEIDVVVAAYRRWLGLDPWPQPALIRQAWTYSAHVRGPDAAPARAAAAAIVQPLELRDPHLWDPSDEYWGEECEPAPDWALAIIAAGARTSYEFEQVLPATSDDPDFDPILDAVDDAHAGDHDEARRKLRALLSADPRCLDAHAHLGWLAFQESAVKALPHYAAGVAIAERGLPERFDGVLPWQRIDNRPFLRCLHGLAVTLWRLKRWDEAAAAAESLLWLSPGDNQGASAVLGDVRARVPWVPPDRRHG
jgi:tetratricopeptide (TPR) repeat protein